MLGRTATHDRHLIVARYKQNEGVALWQNGHHLWARWKFFRAGSKCTVCWLETADFLAAEAKTTLGRDAKWRATRLAKSYYLRGLPQLASPKVYDAIAQQYSALSRLTCKAHAQVAYRRKAAAFAKLAGAACFKDITPNPLPSRPAALMGDTRVPAADDGPLPLWSAMRANVPAGPNPHSNGAWRDRSAACPQPALPRRPGPASSIDGYRRHPAPDT